jgi:hypothetical protein
MSFEQQVTLGPTIRAQGAMTEKLVAFLFAGILGAMFYHLAAAAVLHQMFRSGAAFDWWIVPLAVIPGMLLLALAWTLGFLRRGSTVWGNLGMLASTASIIFFTVGAPYNCLHGVCY